MNRRSRAAPRSLNPTGRLGRSAFAHSFFSPLPTALARDCLWFGILFGDCLRCSEDLVHTCTAVARAREDSVSVYGHAWPLACWMWSGVAAARARACVSAGL